MLASGNAQGEEIHLRIDSGLDLGSRLSGLGIGVKGSGR